ncbi:methyltransferase domain-containing protein [Geoglobus acetivorans]|uniref:Methyltransferase domain-containing protein n=1 Tax=Geoglobus acetivorans TaxID=565033 RepID=A0ABZ3H2G9_GEOAI|nr:methyltransferase domain-containing protein [Geoglobus acetivorans]
MKIRLIGPLKRRYGEVIEIWLGREITLNEALKIVSERYPELKGEIDDIGAYNFSLNGVLVKKDEMNSIKVRDEDEIIVIPAISGGDKAGRVKRVVMRNFDLSGETYHIFEEKHEFFTGLASDLVEFSDCAFESCLDVGCGTGVIARVLDDCDVVGLDISRIMLEKARTLMSHVVQGDGANLPFRDNSFDAVFFNASIFLIPDAGKALEEAMRVVRSGGTVAGSLFSGVYHSGRDALAELGLRHREVYPSSQIASSVLELGGEIDVVDYRAGKGLIIDFYSVPAMSNALFPGIEYGERLKLVKERLENLPQSVEFRWTFFRIPG